VLFADMKGSMELLADRDPEEARKLLDPVLEHMMEAVHRYEGTVNQVMGDGIIALFGAPLARLTASGAPSGTGVGVTSRCVEWRAGRT
jgi:class 3 adenylate cyclase